MCSSVRFVTSISKSSVKFVTNISQCKFQYNVCQQYWVSLMFLASTSKSQCKVFSLSFRGLPSVSLSVRFIIIMTMTMFCIWFLTSLRKSVLRFVTCMSKSQCKDSRPHRSLFSVRFLTSMSKSLCLCVTFSP